MAVKGENSWFFGKEKINFENLKFPKIEVPEIGFPNYTPEDIVSQEELTEKQIEKQNEILDFLKNVTVEQSQTAHKQYITSKKLTYLALIFAFISIVPVLREWLLPENKLNNRIIQLENSNAEKANTIAKLSTQLINLNDKINTLKLSNDVSIETID
ncbi:hypothetical protein [Salegentibacter maritimus]|uniref:Uncharacterized protein n=1 Tax=Salegentibacter maritimus TaxID=2794347 RepID=A0ABS0TDG8_9FLAO|nr:hypothetical protein [Salegentibacter maritimus]MBI6118870.1 hypothetical protein [Salegentibacter maritimus]